jgi:hypothetical protein
MKQENSYIVLLPFFVLYFIFNNFLLPEGLLYTTLLTPLFIYWLYKNSALKSLVGGLILLLIPIPFQVTAGVDIKSFIVSTTLVFTAFIFLFTALQAVKQSQNSLENIFLKILIINSILVFAALLTLPFESLRGFFWNSVPISPTVQGFPRLKLLAYEPSHYALLLSPVLLFYSLKVFTGKSRHPLILGISVVIPFLLSLSFGVLGALSLAVLISSFFYLKKLPLFSKRLLFFGIIFFTGSIIIISFVWSENPVFIRIENIFSGVDTSAKGRLVNSFMFAWDLAMNYNVIFGVGPGQIKILAHDFIVNFYQYTGTFAEVVRIPNSMGEMLATYGLFGFLLKLGIETYFFVRLRIYANLYSLCLFTFIFIYQFTGSFLVNIAEMGIWAFVFLSRFKQFEFDKIKNITE